MDELVTVMENILVELQLINSKLDDIRGSGVNSLDDVCNGLTDIQESVKDLAGSGLYNTLSDVCDKIDSLESTASSIESTILLLS